jgi:hypothetical protein
MKADKYLESIGLENAIGEEFMNDDDKSYYTVEELMESYHQAKLDLLNINSNSVKEMLIDFGNCIKNSKGQELELLADAYIVYDRIKDEE